MEGAVVKGGLDDEGGSVGGRGGGEEWKRQEG